MQIIVEDLGPCKKLVKIEVPSEEMKDDLAKVQKNVQGRANVPGFRIGKAPMHLVEQYYGDVVQNEWIKQVINTSYQKALAEKQLNPIREASVENVDFRDGKKLNFEFHIEVAPQFDLPKYFGIPIKKKKIEVKEEHVEAEIKYLAERSAYFEPVTDRNVMMGDFVIVDYTITAKDQVSDEAKQVWIEVRGDFFIPKFCEELVGMKKDEEKEIKVTLPKEFTKPELSGKKVVIKVKLFEIKKKVLPEINDEFAKQVGPFANLEELKKKIREEIGAYYKQLVEKDTISQIEDFLLKNTKIDVPDSVVDSFHDMIYEENVSYLKNSGKATDEHIKEKEKDLKESARRDAVSQVKLMYIINGIAEKENVQVGDEEINAQVLTTANRTGKTPEEIRGYLTKNDKWWDFAYRMRNDKLTKLLQEKADVTEVELKPEESKIK